MKWLAIFGWAFMIVGAVAFVATFPLAASFSSRAKLVQRMERNAGAELFGESGTAIGTPQLLVIDDSSAFTGEKTAEGAFVVDEGMLRAKGIYPLQLKMVQSIADLVRLATAGLAVIGALLVGWSRRKLRRRRVSLVPES